MKKLIRLALMGVWVLSACDNDADAGGGSFEQTEFQPIELSVTEQTMAQGQTDFSACSVRWGCCRTGRWAKRAMK